MIINLDATHRIRGAERSWNLEQLYVNEGTQRWKPIGYHSTFGNAAQSAVRREIRLHHAEGVKASLEAVEQILAKYEPVFDAVAAK